MMPMKALIMSTVNPSATTINFHTPEEKEKH